MRAAVLPARIPLRQVGEHHLPLVERPGVGGHAPVLAVGVDARGLGGTQRLQLFGAGRLLSSFARVEAHQLARLERMVPRGDAEEQRRAGHGARVDERGGEPGVAAVHGALARAVRVHGEQRLRVHLRAVVVFPARVEHAAVGRERGVVVVHLVERDAADAGAVRLAAVEVAHLGPPAVHDLHAARGVEEDAPVRQVTALVVGRALPGRKLPHRTRRHRHLVEVEVVAAVGRLEGVENPRAVGRDVRVAVAAVLRLQKRRLVPESLRRRLRKTERAADREVGAFALRVGKRLGVGVVRSAHHIVAAVDPARPRESAQTRHAAFRTRGAVAADRGRPGLVRALREAVARKGLREARRHAAAVERLAGREPDILRQPVAQQLVLRPCRAPEVFGRLRRAVQRRARERRARDRARAAKPALPSCFHAASIANSPPRVKHAQVECAIITACRSRHQSRLRRA